MKPSPNGGGFVFIYMNALEKFLSDKSDVRELLDIYLELRQHLQELGFSESELNDPPTYTTKMMNLQEKFNHKFKSLFQLIKDYGFEVTNDDVTSYIMPLLLKINELTPLKPDGNIKRRN
jgi:hypothetical protein